METNTIYIVQAYSVRYEFWGDTQEPVEGLFSFPIVGYDTEEKGRKRLSELRGKHSGTQYRLVRRVTTEEVI